MSFLHSATGKAGFSREGGPEVRVLKSGSATTAFPVAGGKAAAPLPHSMAGRRTVSSCLQKGDWAKCQK